MKGTKLQVEQRQIADLKPYARNPRTHSSGQIVQIANSIREFGFIVPILIDGAGEIIAGHGRYEAAKLLELETVPVIEAAHLSERQKRAFVIADNKLNDQSGWDFEILSAELGELAEMDMDLSVTGFDEQELDGLLKQDLSILPDGWGQPAPAIPPAPDATTSGELREGLIGDDEAPEPEEDIAPVAQPGDVWLLGDHRLMCGDSTDGANVKKLLAGTRPILMVTDPPYGVNYDPEWRSKHGLLKGGSRSHGKVENDHDADWSAAYEHFPGDVAYVWHAALFGDVVKDGLASVGFDIVSQIIWNKHHFVISRGNYHWKHEPCWYAVRKGKKHNWQGARDQSTVWDIKALMSFGSSAPGDENEKTGHGTQKPVECMLRPVLNNSAPGDDVYDPFGGSGSSIIACEKAARRCFMMEISARYCDLIIRRWQAFTGKQAIHEQTQQTYDQRRN